MRIRKLELHGFKSFPDRTDFVFGRGISGIVGPNGCGKSNVVDAVKWVIGETSAKALRGSEMTDILFAGSATRSPVGFSEVSLTFSAEDGAPFPGELAHLTEVQITRRLEKTGNSEYRLNQTRCRKRDITDFLLDTGVSNDLYAFIEQGRIDKMIRARPEERRLLIDEAAGISRYKVRREEALGRLESTAVQLDRAADVEEEMLRRLTVLERQVLTAARFKQLRARVRQSEVALAVVKVSALVQDRRALSAQLRAHKRQVTELEQEWERQEHGLATRRDELASVEAALEQWREDLAEREARRRELEGAAGFSRRLIDEGSRDGERARGEAAHAQTTEETAAAALAAAEEAIEAARAAEARAQTEASSARSAAEAAAAEQAAVRARVDVAKEQVSRATEAVLGVRARLESLRERSGRIPQRERQLESRIEALEQARSEAAGGAETARTRREALRESLAGAEQAQQAATGRAEGCQARWARQQQATQARRTAVDAAEAALSRQLSAAGRGVAALEEGHREVLKQLADQQRGDRMALQVAAQQTRSRRKAEGRQRLGDARRRHQQWGRARDTQHAAAIESLRLDHDAALEELAERQAEANEALGRRAAAALTTALSTVEGRLGTRPFQRALDAALLAEGELQRAFTEARDIHDAARSHLAATQAADAAASASWEEHRRQGRAVGTVLPGAPTLQERLEVPPETEGWLAAVAGEGLGRVVASSVQDVLAVAAELADDEQAVLWLPHPTAEVDVAGDELGRAALAGRLVSHTVVTDLAAALDHFLRGGGGAVVVPGGARVDPDGTVWLGTAGAAGAGLAAQRRAEEARQARARAQQALETAELTMREAQVQRERSRTAAIEAREALEGAREALELARQQARREHQERTRAAQREHDAEARYQRQTLLEQQASALDERRQAQQRLQKDEGTASSEGLVLLEQALERALGEQDQRSIDELEALSSAQQEQEQAIRRLHREDVFMAGARLKTVETAIEQRRLALRETLHRAQALVEELDESRQQARAKLLEAERRCQRLRLEVSRTDADEQAFLLESGRREQDVQQVKSQQGELSQELSELRELEQALLLELDEALAMEGERRTLLHLQQEALLEAETLAAAAMETRTSAEVNAAERAEQVRTVSAQVQTHRAHIEAARGVRVKATAQAEEAEAKVARAREELVSADGQLQQIAKEKAEVQVRLDRDRGRQQKLKSALVQARGAQHELQERLAAVRIDMERVQARLDGLREELGRTRTAVSERYQIEVDGLLDQLEARGEILLEPDESVRAALEVGGKTVQAVEPLLLLPTHLVDEDWVEITVGHLDNDRRALERLGEVNLTAVEEYRELAARHADIAAQREDLEESMSRIRAAIAKINRTCRERFRDAFDAVDGHFRVLYPRLVGGGQASLGLTDEDDLLETGVDIFVQPPGKRLQNLTLLSGGEKAMTAIALMLSLFKVKPSPFCMLDEVDAPLDEGNGSRFNELLVEMSTASQFIVVTHNKKTMEVADTLYGVTMATPGVSRLVTVSLE